MARPLKPKANDEPVRKIPLVRGWSAKVVRPETTFTEPKVQVMNMSASGLDRCSLDLQNNEELKSLDLSYHFFTSADMGTLAEGLKDNTNLGYLYLQGNEFCCEGACLLAEGLKEQGGLAGIHTLNLNTNGIGDVGAKALADFVRHSITIKHLYLRENRIGDTGVTDLSSALHENKTLVTLDLGLNDCGDAGAGGMSDAMLAGARLSLLDLSANGVTSFGCHKLGAAVQNPDCKLKTLILRVNRIRDDGGRTLFLAIRENKSLTKLDVGSNVLRDEAGEILAHVFGYNSVLSEVNLEDNFFTDKSGDAFLRMMQRNEGLNIQACQLRNNKLSDLMKTQLDLYVRTTATEIQKRLAEEKAERKKQRRESRRASRLASNLSGEEEGGSKGGSKSRHGSNRRASREDESRRATNLSALSMESSKQ